MVLGTELLWIVPVASGLAIAIAILLVRDVLKRDTGTEEMVAVSELINEGAVAFLRRQYTTIAILAVVTALIIGALIALFDKYIEVSSITSLQEGYRRQLLSLLAPHCQAFRGWSLCGQPSKRIPTLPQPQFVVLMRP